MYVLYICVVVHHSSNGIFCFVSVWKSFVKSLNMVRYVYMYTCTHTLHLNLNNYWLCEQWWKCLCYKTYQQNRLTYTKDVQFNSDKIVCSVSMLYNIKFSWKYLMRHCCRWCYNSCCFSFHCCCQYYFWFVSLLIVLLNERFITNFNEFMFIHSYTLYIQYNTVYKTTYVMWMYTYPWKNRSISNVFSLFLSRGPILCVFVSSKLY